MESRIAELEKEHKFAVEELHKARLLNEKSKHEFQVEIRKRDVEIGKLKQRITESMTRKLNSGSWSGTISVGQGSSAGKNLNESPRPLIVSENRLPGGFSKVLSSYSSIHKQSKTLSSQQNDTISQQNEGHNSAISSSVLSKEWQDTLVREIRILAHDNSTLYHLINKACLALKNIVEHGKSRANQYRNGRDMETNYGFSSLDSAQYERNNNMNNQFDEEMEDVNMESDNLKSSSNIYTPNIEIPINEKLSYYDTDKRYSMDNSYYLRELGHDIEALLTFESFVQMLNPSKTANNRMTSSYLMYNNNSSAYIQRSGTELARIVEAAPIKKLYQTFDSILTSLSYIVHDSSMVPASELKKKNQEIHFLQQDLDKKTNLWKDALDTMEKWKTYREGRNENIGS